MQADEQTAHSDLFPTDNILQTNRPVVRLACSWTPGGLTEFLVLARVVQSGSDTVDGRAQRIFELRRILPSLLAPQEFHLDQAHRIHIRIAQMNRARQNPVASQQFALSGDAQNHAPRPQELGFQHGEDALAQRRILHQSGIDTGNIQDRPSPFRARRCAPDPRRDAKFFNISRSKPLVAASLLGEAFAARGPRRYHAGTAWRLCIQPKTQGMARRSSKRRPLVRRDGRDPMRAASSSLHRRGLLEIFHHFGFSAMSRR